MDWIRTAAPLGRTSTPEGSGFGDAVGAGLGLVVGQRDDTKFLSDVYGDYIDFLWDSDVADQIGADQLLAIEETLGQEAFTSGEAPSINDPTAQIAELNDLAASFGLEIPDKFSAEGLASRRSEMAGRALSERERLEGVIGEAGPIAGPVGAFVGGMGGEFTQPENLAALAVGAPARLGFMATVGIEALLNAGVEGVSTPGRNEFLRMIGDEEESVLTNMAFGAAFGGGVTALLRSPGAIKRLFRGDAAPAEQQALSEALRASDSSEAQAVGVAMARDLDAAAARSALNDPLGQAEGSKRAVDVAAGRTVPDRPVFDTAPRTALAGAAVEVRAADLEIMPETFQFKSEADAGGVTEKLRHDPPWNDSLSGRVVVYEFADGRTAIVDGHQRVNLAQRIMAKDPTQDIRLIAEVLRESDGVGVEQARVIGAVKNIAEAADGMTAAMARDAAKVLRVDPEMVSNLPVGPGTKIAANLARLSDDGFGLFINDVVPQNFAALVGKLVDDPALHLPIMRLIERLKPANSTQAESLIAQAIAAPRETSVTADLFGEATTTESLFAEKSKVLDRALRLLREDAQTFRTLTDRGDRITEAGDNQLDHASNAEVRKTTDTALALVKKLAHRSGAISEALNDGAKNYKETGKLKDAAQAVASAVRGSIERGDFDGASSRSSGQNVSRDAPRTETPDDNAAFAERDSVAEKDQVAANPVADRDGEPIEAFQEDADAIDDLRKVVDSGANPDEIMQHPSVVDALDAMDAIPETRDAPGYGSEDWHESRVYSFEGDDVTGTEAALARWMDDAETLASREEGVEFNGVDDGYDATIVLGPPAAGKSTIANEIALTRRAAILDADEIKKTIPEYQGGIGAAATHEESADLLRDLEGVATQAGTNLVIPKVGGQLESIAALVDRLADAGYKVHVVNMDVKPQEAFRRMIGRFISTGRLIDPAYVFDVGDKPSVTYRNLPGDKLAGRAVIDNNGALNGQKVTEVIGNNPLAGSRFDPSTSGQPDRKPADTGSPKEDQQSGGRTEQTPEGEQHLIAGIEPITDLDRLQRRADAPLMTNPRLGDTEIGGLFDPNAPERFDLFDAVPVGLYEDANGDIRPDARPAKEVARELDEIDDFLDTAEVCLK